MFGIDPRYGAWPSHQTPPPRSGRSALRVGAGPDKWCSSDSSAVATVAAITTTFAAAARIARSRPRMSGAVSRLPLDASGLAPRSSGGRSGSTSGTGTLKPVPNHQAVRELPSGTDRPSRPSRCCTTRAPEEHAAIEHRGEWWAAGVADIDAHGVAAAVPQDRRQGSSISAKASPSRRARSPHPPCGASASAGRRILVQRLERDALRTQEACEKTVSASPRTAVTSPLLVVISSRRSPRRADRCGRRCARTACCPASLRRHRRRAALRRPTGRRRSSTTSPPRRSTSVNVAQAEGHPGSGEEGGGRRTARMVSSTTLISKVAIARAEAGARTPTARRGSRCRDRGCAPRRRSARDGIASASSHAPPGLDQQ